MSFDSSLSSTPDKLKNFTKCVRRQSIARFLAQTELFQMQIGVKGSIVEGGVHHGGGVMCWAQLSATLEPYNYHRRVIGFDTFEGFPHVSSQDDSGRPEVAAGLFAVDYDVFDEISEQVREFDSNRFLGDISKVELIRGDATVEMPAYVERNPHLIVSMLYLDFDLYEPTVSAIGTFLPRMPKGGVIVFDEANNPHWPGETRALLDSLEIGDRELRCFVYEPNISYVIL